MSMETLDINDLLGLSTDFADPSVLVEAVESISPGLEFNGHLNDSDYSLLPTDPVRLGQEDDDLVDVETVEDNGHNEVIQEMVVPTPNCSESEEQHQTEEIETEIITDDFISDYTFQVQATESLTGIGNGIEAEDMNSLFEQFEKQKDVKAISEPTVSNTTPSATSTQYFSTAVHQPSKYACISTPAKSCEAPYPAAAKQLTKVALPQPAHLSLLANKSPRITIIKPKFNLLNRVTQNMQTKPKGQKAAVSLLNHNTKIVQIGSPSLRQPPSTKMSVVNTGSIATVTQSVKKVSTTILKPTKMVVKQQQGCDEIPERSYFIVRSPYNINNQPRCSEELTLAGGEVTVETETAESYRMNSIAKKCPKAGSTEISDCSISAVDNETTIIDIDIANADISTIIANADISMSSSQDVNELAIANTEIVCTETIALDESFAMHAAQNDIFHTPEVIVDQGRQPDGGLRTQPQTTIEMAECSTTSDSIVLNVPGAVSSEVVLMETDECLPEVPDIKTEVEVESEEIVPAFDPIKIKQEPWLEHGNGSKVLAIAKEAVRRSPWLVESEPSSRSSSRRSSRRSSPKTRRRTSPESTLNKIPGYMSEFSGGRSGPIMDDTMITAARSLLSNRLGHSTLLHRDPSPEAENMDYSRIPGYCSNFTSGEMQTHNPDELVMMKSKRLSAKQKKHYRSNKSKHSKKHKSQKKKRSKHKHSSGSSSESSDDEVLLVGKREVCSKPLGYRSPDRTGRHSRSNRNSDGRSRRSNSRSLSSLSRSSISSRSISHSRGNSCEPILSRSHSRNHSSSRSHGSHRRDDSLERDRRRRGSDRRMYESSSYSDSLSRSRSRSRSYNRKFRSRRGRNKRGRRRRSRSYNSGSGSDRSPSPNRKAKLERKAAHDKAMAERRVVYAGGISDRCAPSDLRRRFERFGEIENTTLHFRHSGDNYGFVTFFCQRDAHNAIEGGNKIPGPKYTLCYGGRRLFCKTDYADLDGCTAVKEEWALSEIKRDDPADDFDALLKQTLKKIKT